MPVSSQTLIMHKKTTAYRHNWRFDICCKFRTLCNLISNDSFSRCLSFYGVYVNDVKLNLQASVDNRHKHKLWIFSVMDMAMRMSGQSSLVVLWHQLLTYHTNTLICNCGQSQIKGTSNVHKVDSQPEKEYQNC